MSAVFMKTPEGVFVRYISLDPISIKSLVEQSGYTITDEENYDVYKTEQQVKIDAAEAAEKALALAAEVPASERDDDNGGVYTSEFVIEPGSAVGTKKIEASFSIGKKGQKLPSQTSVTVVNAGEATGVAE